MQLSDYRFGYRIHLDKGQITPKMAVLMLLMGGPMTRSDLRKALSAWRPKSDKPWHAGSKLFYVYLFNKNYGHVADSFMEDCTLSSYAAGRAAGKKAYWYRLSRGRYAISRRGFEYLASQGIKELT
jgi:hypothetical protein